MASGRAGGGRENELVLTRERFFFSFASVDARSGIILIALGSVRRRSSWWISSFVPSVTIVSFPRTSGPARSSNELPR